MFYAIPEMHTRDGQIVNAVFWVAKFIRSLTEMSPDDTIVVASESGSNFRESLYTEYKGTRDRMPDNLRSQIDMIFHFFTLTGIPVLVREWYEADDVIWSIVQEPDGYSEIVIISSDKDLCQFVEDGKIRVFDAMKQKSIRRADVIEKFGVPPEQVVDYLSIVWDSSDNIPGIAGFGPKKAVDLLTKYDTLHSIYEQLWIMNHESWMEMQVDQEKYDACDLTEKTKQVLIDQMENAFLSQKLASIVTTLDISIEDVKWVDSRTIFTNPLVIEFLKKYEFKSLIPAEYREVKKELEKKKSLEIETLDALMWLREKYMRSQKIYIATEKDWNIALGIGEEVYMVDPRIVDISDFFALLLETDDIQIVWYDLKEDLKRILAYKNTLQMGEGQGRLF
jgi:5'-3' exonuclease